MTTTLDIAALANAILYPIVLLVIFLLFRKEIPALLKSISGRLTKLEVAGISLELAKAEAWLNTEILQYMLGEALLTESIKSGSNASTKEQQLKRCLTLAHPFIAVVKENYRFDYLVKREKLLEQLLAK
jgi:hypothetical protein